MDPPQDPSNSDRSTEVDADVIDIMNDPTDAVKLKNVDDPDTCRICRGEGSKEEPLFYPCKCSGSIKFVHQSCLMEWLSHSQKKHCELCKTPFRFTKLYHPQMPNTVPLPVFIRQAALHTWKSFLAWSRMHLVLFVWVAWLPWSMRAVWRGLFWIGDGGWVREQVLQNMTSFATQASASMSGAMTASQTSVLSKDDAAAAVISQMAKALPPVFSPVSQTLNYSSSRSTLFRLAKHLIWSDFRRGSGQASFIGSVSEINNASSSSILSSGRNSWLADIRFLKSLTRSAWLNGIVIDVLEGQLITLSVVITFILVFLIREWVVQQQPAIDMGAAANRDAVGVPPEQAPALQQPARQDAVQRVQQAQEAQVVAVEDENNRPPQLPRGPRIFARPRARRNGQQAPNAQGIEENVQPLAQDLVPNSSGKDQTDDNETNEASNSSTGNQDRITDSGSINQRPSMPTRGEIAMATHIRRTLEEHSRALGEPNWPGVNVFMDLWHRAGGSPSEVLRIIEQEGRTDELAWVVKAMHKLVKTTNAVSDVDLHLEDMDEAAAERSSESSSKSWQIIKNEIVDPNSDNSETSQAKYSQAIENAPRSSGFWNEVEDPTLASGSGSKDPGVVGSHVEASTGDNAVGADTDRMPTGSADYHGSQVKYSSSNMIVPTPVVEEQYINASESSSTFQEGPVIESSSNPFHPDSTDRDLPLVREVASPAEGLAEVSSSTQPNDPHIDVEHNSQDDDPAVSLQIASNVLPATQEEPVPPTLTEMLMNWLWGEVTTVVATQDPNVRDDEHVVHNIADEPPFVPIAHGQPVIGDANQAANIDEAANNEIAIQFVDPEVAAAAAQAGLDVEAVEDGEDMEGIMELIGMQGPIGGLVQNGMFCAVLVSLTLVLGIWVPYISGKVLLVLLANPLTLLVKVPLSWTSNMADFFVDTSIYFAGYAFFVIDTIVRFLCVPVGLLIPFFTTISQNMLLAMTAKSYADHALDRLFDTFIITGDKLFESDIPFFSIIAHESLRDIKTQTTEIWRFVMDNLTFAIKRRSAEESSFVQGFQLVGSTRFGIKPFLNAVGYVAAYCIGSIRESTSLARKLLQTRPLYVSLDIPKRTAPLDYGLVYWNTRDRITAILLGYGLFAIIGALYLQMRRLLQGSKRGDKVEGTLADVLYQAGGVLKVILIISIEMIVFPLYCGLLLDVALLPLFGNASILSRIDFTIISPNTSLFVHWFVGTCYMFHFALFVSMCRKIMRSGVLCKSSIIHGNIWLMCLIDFIRDPDDPTFHPVRDVLERSVASQLRKIAFSALVYGALVFICLGGVVWGLSYIVPGVFPIHWSSNEPVLEFPVDLLFYNFLMPLAVKFFKPSKALTRMYGWWFRKCARALRLTHFLFGERKADEEGQHVYQTWRDNLWGNFGVFKQLLRDNDDQDTETAFRQDGLYVRAPASDQVRIPKGAPTFVEVNESDERADGQPDLDQGLHGRQNKMFSKVYVPPYFRFRIGAFVILIWLFAAITGIGMTIIPLVVGRKVFAWIFPQHVRMNDVYAISIGIYVLGGLLFTLLKYRQILHTVCNALRPSTNPTIAAFLWSVLSQGLRTVRLVYVYSAFAFLLPSLFVLVMELYAVIPLHTYFGGIGERHVIHFVQDWTLGVLCVKMAGKIILWRETSRPANALRAIIRQGWLNPDAKIATRAFILPATLLMSFAILLPFPMAWAVNETWFSDTGEAYQSAIYRYSYPAVLGFGMGMACIYLVGKALKGWRQRIRDEVYLIGERLHNFGERRGVGRDLGKRIATRA